MVDLFEQRGIDPSKFAAAIAAGGATSRAGGGRDLFAERGIDPTQFQTAAKPQDAQLGAVSSGALGVGQGLTFGFSDELAGLLAGAYQSLPGGEGFQAGYRSGTDFVRGLHNRAQPGTFLAGDVVGSLVLPGGVARTGATLGARAARGALTGATEGAIGGFGRAEGSAGERAPAAATGAALGGALGGAVGAAIPAASQRIQRLMADTGDDALTQAGDEALDTIRRAATEGRQGVSDAYDAIAKLEGRIEGKASFELLRGRLGRTLDEGGFRYVPGVGDDVQKTVDTLLSDLGDSAPIQQLEGTRKGLNRAIGNLANDPARKAAMVAIKSDFDDWMVDTITNGLYRDDPTVVDTLKRARQLNTDYQRLFGLGGTTQERTAGRILDQLINDDVGPGEAVNLLFGMSGTGIKASRRALARIRDISPDALDQLKIAHFNKILSPNGGPFDSADKISGRIQKLNANQSQMMKILYGEDLGALNRFGSQIDKSRSPAEAVAVFLTSKPTWVRAGLGVTGIAGSAALGENPFIGAILAALAPGGGGRAAVTSSQLRRAAVRADEVSTRRGARRIAGASPRLGGVVAGPSREERTQEQSLAP